MSLQGRVAWDNFEANLMCTPSQLLSHQGCYTSVHMSMVSHHVSAHCQVLTSLYMSMGDQHVSAQCSSSTAHAKMLVSCNVCVLFTQTLVTGAVLSSGQDTTRSRKIPENKYGGFACFEMPWWGSLQVK